MTSPEPAPGASRGSVRPGGESGEGEDRRPPRREEHRPFVLFACCVPVRGARRSVVCDLQRRTYRLIPDGLYEILTEHRGRTIAEIKAAYGHECDREIDRYFDVLLEHELGFFTEEPERFPPLDLDYQTPSRITNAIIDVDAGSGHDFAAIFRQLDDLGCQAVELRCFAPLRLDELRDALAPTRAGRLRAINLLLTYTPELENPEFAALVEAERRLDSITVHSSPAARETTLGRSVAVTYVVQAIGSPACCGVVHPRYFTANVETFAEARRFNSCLHRKIAVDARGEIRNCPSLPRSYGNVRDTSLHGAVAQRDFPALWAINKDQVAVCRDCEFRYICIDCRAYLTDAQDLYSKPAKCGYDPYTAEWHPPIGKAGEERAQPLAATGTAPFTPVSKDAAAAARP